MINCTKTLKSNAGMSLAEVIVAVCIFAFIATPLLTVFAQSARADKQALFTALATYTAQLKVEEAFGMNEADLLANYNTGGFVSFDPTNPGEVVLTEYGFEYMCEAKIYEDVGGNTYKTTYEDDLFDPPVIITLGTLYKVEVTVQSKPDNVSVTMEDIIYVRP